MKKATKKALSIALALILMVPFMLPVSATSVTPRNSYVSQTISHNGVNYACSVSIGFNPTTGAHTTCATVASCTRIHNVIYLTYMTTSDGIISHQGGYAYRSNVSGTSTSENTGFRSGLSSATQYIEMSSNVTVICIDVDGKTNDYTFYLYANK